MEQRLMGFSVACMAREPAHLLTVFLDHYVSAGAEHIYLYIDGDASDVAHLSSQRIHIFECHEAFWAARAKVLPQSVVPKQRVAFNDAYQLNTSEWLLLCDADELVHGNVTAALDRVPKELDFTRLLPFEAIWCKGENVNSSFQNRIFRKCLPRIFGKALSLAVYGADIKFLQRGIASHTMGKSFVRKGRQFASMGVHMPAKHPAASKAWLDDVCPNNGVRLLHYSAIDFTRWRTKTSGRIDGTRRHITIEQTVRHNPAYAALLREFVIAAKSGQERNLFERVFMLEQRQIKALSLFNQIFVKS